MDSTRTPDGGDNPETATRAFSVGSLLGDLEHYAAEFGRAKRLQSSDGTWFCYGCGGETEFHTSLHCEFCREQAANRKRKRAAARAAESDEDWRWRALARAVASDPRLDREGALKLLQRARELPSHTADRMSGLNLVFDKRFDQAAPGASWSTYVDRSLPGDEAEQGWERGYEP